jgi:hypothetical protein
VACVLALLGQPTTPDYINDVFIIITYESSGNPNAINNWDINAQHGDPSRGLMQTIMTTFEANRDPALPDNIYDPAANIYAGLNYGIHRYGSIPGIPGVYNVNHGGGYVGYAHDVAGVALRGARPCRAVDQGASQLMVVVRRATCTRAIKLARSLVNSRPKTWRRLVRIPPDVLSRPFKLHGFSCRFKRFSGAEVARLDLTKYWVGCFAGHHHVVWTSRPAHRGKNRARRIVKSRRQTR